MRMCISNNTLKNIFYTFLESDCNYNVYIVLKTLPTGMGCISTKNKALDKSFVAFIIISVYYLFKHTSDNM
jgi:hypothetical protein